MKRIAELKTKMLEQLLLLEAGEYFNVIVGDYIIRVNKVKSLRQNGTAFNSIVIGINDTEFICSAPKDSPGKIMNTFLKKIEKVYGLKEKDIFDVKPPRAYEIRTEI